MRKVRLSLVIVTLLGLFSISALAVEGNADKPAVQPDKAAVAAPEPIKPEPGKLDKEKSTSIFGDQAVIIDGKIADIPKEINPETPMTITVINGDVKNTVVLERPDVLKFKGLVLADGAKISVSGWQVTDKDKKFVKAREVTMGEKTIILLNAMGNKTWSDFEVAEVIVLQGTIQNVVMPVPETAAPDAAKPADTADVKPGKPIQKFVSFDLVTEKETIKFAEFCPFAYAVKSKLALANGQKVIITGKQRGAKGILTVLKISIVGVENSEVKLRDEKGNAIWMQRPSTGPKPKPEGDKPKTEGGNKPKEDVKPPAAKEEPKKEQPKLEA